MTKKNSGWLRRARQRIEYVVLRSLGRVVAALPEASAAQVGRGMGRLAWTLSPRRRHRALRNVERALGSDLTHGEAQRLAKNGFQSFGLTVAEILWADRNLTPDDLEDRCPLEGADRLERALATGRGALLVSMHLGNWELFGARLARRFGGLTALARPAKNPYVARRIHAIREQMGIRLISTADGLRPVIRALRGGELVGILIDQHVRRSATAARFFGHPASTTAVAPSLALRLDVPVFLGWTARQGGAFRHRGWIEGPVELPRTGDQEADVRAGTQLLNDLLEEKIRAVPEQWHWHDRRWKLAERLERRAEADNGGTDAGQPAPGTPRQTMQNVSSHAEG
ncbi:MAG: lysophospholipid acyltransferase family protein [bacterium]